MNLLEHLVGFVKQLLVVTRRVDNHDDDLSALRDENKAMQAEIRTMATSIRDIEYQVQQIRENAVYEREKLLLQLDNHLLRAGLDLKQGQPPPTALPPPED
jgi:hypothetical protein